MTLQAKLGYVLIGILGEKCLRQYGYPHICVIRILHHILDMAGVKVRNLKSDNLQYNTVGRCVDGMIVQPSDGAMFIFLLSMDYSMVSIKRASLLNSTEYC